MSIVIPQFLVGRNVNLAAVNPIQVASDGSGILTLGDTSDLKALGVFDMFDYQGELNSEKIQPLDAGVANNVGLDDDFVIRVGEIEQVQNYSNLMSIWYSSRYMRVAVQARPEGSDSGGYLFVAIGMRKSIGKGLVAGKNGVIMTLVSCNIPIYYGTGSSPI